MAGAFVIRLPFLTAAACIAAALADSVVESVANTGIFGGHYADNNHLGVIPAFLVGVIVALEFAAMHVVAGLRRSAHGADTWLRYAARAIAERSPVPDLPFVFAMQIVALFLLESAEQFAVGGTALRGSQWLGGPIGFSLLLHASACVGCTFALRSVMCALARTFATFICAIRFVWLAIARASGHHVCFNVRPAACLRAQSPHVRQTGGRAPPLLQTAYART